MKRYIALFILLLVLPAQMAAATSVSVKNLRLWNAPDNTRIVLDLSGSVEHRITMFKNPPRVAIDLKGGRLTSKLPKAVKNNPYVKRFRYGQYTKDVLRIVIDLKREVRVKSFTLKPNDTYGYRLVVDLHDKYTASPTPKYVAKPKPAISGGRIVVAIDAGHGGEDSGARGRRKTKEKTVVLSIAKELEKLLAKDKAFQPYMVRKSDYYVALRKRTRLASQQNAHLFVSIHADAFKKSSARGASVYTLSSKGATSEMARVLANKENSSDLAGGVSIRDKDDYTAKTLFDLSKDKTLEYSLLFGDSIHKELRGFARMHSKKVQQARFVVLKTPNIASVLVETGFISNPGEEKKLRSSSYQKKLARAIYKGIKDFRRKHPEWFLDS
jgi:N-acetylmuramoyl-L-alanine amidase